MKKKNVIIIAVYVSVVAVLLVGGLVVNRNGVGDNAGFDAAAFYKGQSIKWIIPYSPGGGYDEYARLLAPYLSKYTGARVDILNLPGAGGMRGVNELFTSPNTGLIIGMINGSALVTNQLAGISGANYKLDEFEYLGRIIADPRVLIVSNTSGYSTFNDMLNANTIIKIGATGLGGSTYVDAVLSKEALDMNVEIIHGFDSSSDVRQSMLRGNIAGGWGSYGSSEDGVDTGSETVVLQSGRERIPDLPDVPTVFEYADSTSDPERTRAILTAWDALIAVGRSIAVPPGTMPEKVEFLRTAFYNAMHDPDMIAISERSGRPLDYADGDEITRITLDALVMPDETEQLFIRLIRGQL